MTLQIRSATPADAEDCGRIVYEAFLSIAEQHRFRPDFPSAQIATEFVASFLQNPSIFGGVAERACGGVQFFLR